MNFHAKRRREEVTREHESCLRAWLVVRFPPRVVHLIFFLSFFLSTATGYLSFIVVGKISKLSFFMKYLFKPIHRN